METDTVAVAGAGAYADAEVVDGGDALPYAVADAGGVTSAASRDQTYTSGSASASASALPVPDVYVWWASESGNAEALAHQLGATLRYAPYKKKRVRVLPVSDFRAVFLCSGSGPGSGSGAAEADHYNSNSYAYARVPHVFFISSWHLHGPGFPPEMGIEFFRYLRESVDPALAQNWDSMPVKGIDYCVFGLGDRRW